MNHPCPIRRCPREVPEHLLMCGIHWRLVSSPLQGAVYSAYRHGEGRGSLALLQAQRAAIRFANERVGEVYP